MEDVYFNEENKNLPGTTLLNLKTTTLASDDVRCSFIWLLQLLPNIGVHENVLQYIPKLKKMKEKMVNVHFKPNFGVRGQNFNNCF